MTKLTLLDPRFKDTCFFTDTNTRIKSVSNFKTKMSTSIIETNNNFETNDDLNIQLNKSR
jgi:hypothetical protein